MSTICKTQGVVLRTWPHSETSVVISWLTPDFGRIATLAKGAHRPRSDFLGQFDLFQTCELLFYWRDARGVYIAREISVTRARERFRADWRAAAAASYVTDLVSRIALPDTPQADIFQALVQALDTLADAGATPAFLSWFELKLLDVLGLAPRLTHCIACAKRLEPGAGRVGFSPSRGGMVCASCSQKAGDSIKPVAPDVLAALLGWQRSRSSRAAYTTRTRVRQMDEIESFLGRFLRHHLDLPLPSRDIALDLLRRRFA